jgi:hypothetical protein
MHRRRNFAPTVAPLESRALQSVYIARGVDQPPGTPTYVAPATPDMTAGNTPVYNAATVATDD